MRTTGHRPFLGFVWVAAGALLVAGCSQNPPSVTSSNASGARLTSPTSTTPATPATPGVYTTALAAGIAGAEAKTGYSYFDTPPADTSKPVLIGGVVFGNTDPSAGLDAAAVQLGIDYDGTIICYSYVFYEAGSWHFTTPVSCELNLSSPWPGQNDRVNAGSSCANVRQAPGLSGKVVTCLKSGTSVLIDKVAPEYVDGHIWWSVNYSQGWMANDLLIT
jgi:hypothetical protein